MPQQCRLESAEESHTIEPKLMDVLVFLCERAGVVVSSEELLIALWRGTFYGDNPVHRSIALLRRVLGDSASQSQYITTIRKRGYCIVGAVSFPAEYASAPAQIATWVTGNPFPGLAPFSEDRQQIFFGRSHAQAEVLSRLRTRLEEKQGFVLVLGPSGSGKTSLLQAGVLPLLTQPGGFDGCHAVAVARLEPTRIACDAYAALTEAMLQWRIAEEPLFFGTESATLTENLRSDPSAIRATIADRMQRRGLAPSAGDYRPFLLLVLDQMERAFGEGENAANELRQLFSAATNLLEGGMIAMIAGCRNDYYPRLALISPLVTLKGEGGQFDLPSLSSGEIAQVIRSPAAAAGLTFEQEKESLLRLDDVLRDDAVLQPQSLPLLQHALSMLYEQRTSTGVLTFASYRAIGGIAGALAQHAESVYAALPPAAQHSLPVVLRKMVALDEEDRLPIGRQVPWPEADQAAVSMLVRGFVEQRLFVSVLLGEEAAYAAAHESLFQNWPRISAWVGENQQLLLLRSRLTLAERRWRSEDERKDFLLPIGSQLDDASRLVADGEIALSRDERRFIDASLHRARMQHRLRFGAIASIVALGFLAGAAGIIAMIQRKDAIAQRSQAESLVAFMLGGLTDNLRSLGKLDLLDSVGNESMRYLVSASSDPSDLSTQLLREKALRQVGEIRLARGDTKGAADSFDRAATLARSTAAAHPESADAWLGLGNAVFWQGQVQYRAAEYLGAERSWTAYLDAAKKLNALKPADAKAKLELSYAHNNLATLAFRRGRYDEAAGAFGASLDLKREAHELDPHNAEILAETADTLNWLGSTDETKGDLKGAENVYRQAEAILDDLQQAHPDDQRWRYRSGIAAMRSADALLSLGKLAESENEFVQADALLRSLAELDPQNQSWVRDATYASAGLGRAKFLGGDHPEGIRLIRLASNAAEELAHKDESADDYRRLLATVHVRSAECSADRPESLLTALTTDIDALTVSSAKKKAKSELLSRSLAELLVTRASIESAEQSHRDVDSALDVLTGPNLPKNSAMVLDLRVRALLLDGREADATSMIQQLARAGYRHPAYVQFLQTHQRENK